MKERYSDFAKISAVAIPAIQRDYVQGADRNFHKRDSFIKTIFDHLVSGQDLEIDFIYGSSDIDEKGVSNKSHTYFLPVDGQQRLTTLALIAWSLNNKLEGKYDDQLPQLTYLTRPSSEQFMVALFRYRINDGSGKISEHIRTIPGWFSPGWLLDPSINAMLEMLDKLNELLDTAPYKDELEIMAERFFMASPITFERLDMKALQLTDDLYVKMNARGKMLTPFENWKAGFEGMLNKQYAKEMYPAGQIPQISGAVSYYDYFIYAVEHDWCDLLWDDALKRWEQKSEQERKKSIYPRIDEDFMRIVEFVSDFLFFSQTTEQDPQKELFDKNRDAERDKLYRNREDNLQILLRVFDTFVKIKKAWHGNTDDFYNKIFTKDYDPWHKRVLLVGDISDANLYRLCLEEKLNYSGQILLWALLKYLILHPKAIENPDDALRDYMRIVAGWLTTLRQRLVKGLAVRPNIRLSSFSDASKIIDTLAPAANVFAALLTTTLPTLGPERRKARYTAIGDKYDIIRVLSTRKELYYSFNLLYDSIDQAASAAAYVGWFDTFVGMNDVERIRSLVSHGYVGVQPIPNHHFYGVEGKWDFIFTISDKEPGAKAARDAFTAWFTGAPALALGNKEFNYYLLRYDEFINAVASDNKPLHYFIRENNSQFVAWAVKTTSSRPKMGYNVDPYGYAVSKSARVAHPKLELDDYSYYSDPGVLYLSHKDSENTWLTAECTDDGWLLGLVKISYLKVFGTRFVQTGTPGSPTLTDTKGEFTFSGMTLLDKPSRDRIETLRDFLAAL